MSTLTDRIRDELTEAAVWATRYSQKQSTHIECPTAGAGTRGVTAFFTLGCWCSFGHGCIQREVDGEHFLLV